MIGGAAPVSFAAMKLLRPLAALVLAFALVACKDDPPKSTRWDQAASAAASAAQAAASAAASTPPPPKTETGAVNKFFPKAEAGTKLVYSVDKPGYAEAKLLADDGGELGNFTVGDADADATAKFASAKDKLGTYPLVTVGKNQSAILVGTRQVKMTSKTLDPDARKAWLGKFDLAGLAALPPPAASATP